MRHDGGDAETGFGIDFGGGIAWSDPKSGLGAELRGRGLLTHDARGFRERGFSGSLAWDPTPSSQSGPKLTLTQTVGASASGGADALLARGTLAGLGASSGPEASDTADLLSRRLDIKFGYGFAAGGGGKGRGPVAGSRGTPGDSAFRSRHWVERDRHDRGARQGSRPAARDPGGAGGRGRHRRMALRGSPPGSGVPGRGAPEGHDQDAAQGHHPAQQGGRPGEQGDRRIPQEAGRGEGAGGEHQGDRQGAVAREPESA